MKFITGVAFGASSVVFLYFAVKYKTSSFISSAKDGVETMKLSTKERVELMKQSTKERVETMKELAKEGVETMKQSAKEGVEKMKSHMPQKMRKKEEEEGVEEGKEVRSFKVREISDRIKQRFKGNNELEHGLSNESDEENE